MKCGAKLSDGQQNCPICQTRVYHPDLAIEPSPTYPNKDFISEEFNKKGLLLFITILCGLVSLFLPTFELVISSKFEWSGYALGAILICYVSIVLPSWFKRRSPAIFIPASVTSIIVFLLYINLTTNGNWFLTFAFPITASVGIIITVCATLIYYLRRGRLYIVGGSIIALGIVSMLIEMLLYITFDIGKFISWSIFPLTTLIISGILLIIIAIIKPLKEKMKKVFFI